MLFSSFPLCFPGSFLYCIAFISLDVLFLVFPAVLCCIRELVFCFTFSSFPSLFCCLAHCCFSFCPVSCSCFPFFFFALSPHVLSNLFCALVYLFLCSILASYLLCLIAGLLFRASLTASFFLSFFTVASSLFCIPTFFTSFFCFLPFISLPFFFLFRFSFSRSRCPLPAVVLFPLLILCFVCPRFVFSHIGNSCLFPSLFFFRCSFCFLIPLAYCYFFISSSLFVILISAPFLVHSHRCSFVFLSQLGFLSFAFFPSYFSCFFSLHSFSLPFVPPCYLLLLCLVFSLLLSCLLFFLSSLPCCFRCLVLLHLLFLLISSLVLSSILLWYSIAAFFLYFRSLLLALVIGFCASFLRFLILFLFFRYYPIPFLLLPKSLSPLILSVLFFLFSVFLFYYYFCSFFFLLCVAFFLTTYFPLFFLLSAASLSSDYLVFIIFYLLLCFPVSFSRHISFSVVYSPQLFASRYSILLLSNLFRFFHSSLTFSYHGTFSRFSFLSLLAHHCVPCLATSCSVYIPFLSSPSLSCPVLWSSTFLPLYRLLYLDPFFSLLLSFSFFPLFHYSVFWFASPLVLLFSLISFSFSSYCFSFCSLVFYFFIPTLLSLFLFLPLILLSFSILFFLPYILLLLPFSYSLICHFFLVFLSHP